MGEFKIISDKDKDGNFVVSSEAWTKEKISDLLDKYYPKRIANRKIEEKTKAEEKK